MEIADTKNTVMNMLQKWPKLIEWLEEKEYFIAPASKEHHGAYKGGTDGTFIPSGV